MPEVSVIMPVYNAEASVEKTLDALASQTLDSMEIIAIDDGSQDATGQILDSYALKCPRLQVIHTPNQGIYRARLEGIGRAKGEYLAFCDADDLPSATMYEELLMALKNNGAQMSVCGYVREEAATGKVLATEMTSFGDIVVSTAENMDILPVINTAVWNKMFRADAVRDILHYEEPPRVMEDMMFCCASYPNIARIAFIAKPLYRYLVHPRSAMAHVDPQEISLLQKCMIETRNAVAQKGEGYARICDTMAFIHFGLSAVLRRVQGGEDTAKVVREAESYLNKYHPHWKQAGRSLVWNLKNGNILLKPLLARYFYQLHLMRPFLWAYRFVTEKLKIDIKW